MVFFIIFKISSFILMFCFRERFGFVVISSSCKRFVFKLFIRVLGFYFFLMFLIIGNVFYGFDLFLERVGNFNL